MTPRERAREGPRAHLNIVGRAITPLVGIAVPHSICYALDAACKSFRMSLNVSVFVEALPLPAAIQMVEHTPSHISPRYWELLNAAEFFPS